MAAMEATSTIVWIVRHASASTYERQSTLGRWRIALIASSAFLLVFAPSCARATQSEIGSAQQAVPAPPATEKSEIISSRVEPTSPVEPTSTVESTSTASTEAALPELEATVVAHAVAQTIQAHQAPDPQAETIATFANPTMRGGPLVFQAIGLPSEGWIEVLLPVRPNGTTGWIAVDQVELSRNPYRIDIDVDQFALTVSRYGEPVLETTIGIGDTDTPTPLGDFYLVELLRPPDPNGVYGSYAYGLSGYSEVLSEFSGGEAVIGIHGTNRPDLLGQNVSFGCIRVENAVIEELATFLPLGTPVSIVT